MRMWSLMDIQGKSVAVGTAAALGIGVLAGCSGQSSWTRIWQHPHRVERGEPPAPDGGDTQTHQHL